MFEALAFMAIVGRNAIARREGVRNVHLTELYVIAVY